MTNPPPTPPTRFDPRRMFLASGWNIFVVIFGSLCLWATGSVFLRAWQAPGWWPDVAWAFLFLVIGHSVWTSASRLWQARKSG